LSPRAQAPQLPAVNLGDTSFLDRIAFPGWLTETINQGEHAPPHTNRRCGS
jgi:hypothetical protein